MQAFDYDANGNLENGAGKTVTWTSYNYPSQVTNGSRVNQFRYGPNRQRIKETRLDGGSTLATTVISSRWFETDTQGSLVTHTHHIRAGAKVIAVHQRKSNGQTRLHYLHRDHLGSISAITDADGNVVERASHDAFGQRRDPGNWNGPIAPSELEAIRTVTTRGYTGHPMLDDINLIHMGGRIYDPALGRFLSPDPNIPSPGNTQAYNRYAYVYNNPLRYTDPSGFMPKNPHSPVPLYDCSQCFAGSSMQDHMLEGTLGSPGMYTLGIGSSNMQMAQAGKRAILMSEVIASLSRTETANEKTTDSVLNAGDGELGPPTATMDGKVIIRKHGGGEVKDAERQRIEAFLQVIFESGGAQGRRIQEAMMMDGVSTTIILNSLDVNASKLGGFILAIDLNTHFHFFDSVSKQIVLMTILRVFAHELSHAALGLPDENVPLIMTADGHLFADRSATTYPNVKFIDQLMGNIMGNAARVRATYHRCENEDICTERP